ncbi:MAG TPA: hypothetical protein VF173_10680 [Thermoanaerobaculia bacterium]|nr:hypothetical protein [Thermoanaerobaculia bacterium]
MATSPSTRSSALDPGRLLADSLGTRLLDLAVGADVYARNAFRLLGLTAATSGDALERELQKFRNLLKLNPATALRAAIATGYDELVPLKPEDARESVARLANPRQRILAELFWPHLPADLFAPARSSRRLDGLQDAWSLAGAAAGDGLPGALARHALAVVHHNRALAGELAFAAGEAEPSREAWVLAHSFWAEVHESSELWTYLRQRAESFDDLRLTAADVETLRAGLPAVLLSFHTLFARAYATAGMPAASARHLDLIRRSGLPAPAQNGALETAARALVSVRTDPLVRKVESELLGRSKLKRQQFDAVCAPILREAEALRGSLLSDFGIPEDVLPAADFDDLCERIAKAVDQSIDYAGEDNRRSILYSSLIARRMLALPLSSGQRETLERSLRKDAEILYRDFLPAGGVDPTRCWFLESEEADPDASIELSVYKITGRTVQADSSQSSTGIRVSYSTRRLLIPRSARARDAHSGKLKVEDLPEERLDLESRRLARRIREDEARQRTFAESERLACEKEIAEEEARARVELEKHSQRQAAEEKTAAHRLEEIVRQRERKLGDESRRCQAELAAARSRAAAAIAQARTAEAKVVEENRGLRGGWRLEAPAVTSGAGILGLLGWGLQPSGVAGILGVLLGAVLGLALARWVRVRRRARATALVAAAQSSARVEETRITKAGEKAAETLRREAQQASVKAKAQLETLAAEKRTLQEQSENRKREIRGRHDKTVQDSKKASVAKVNDLRRRLKERLQGKPESAKSDFPAYRTAFANGFKLGTEPSGREMEMTAAEQEQARMLLYAGRR